MKHAYSRLVAAALVTMALATPAQAEAENYCYANGTHCCDSSGWCFFGCRFNGEQGSIPKNWAAGFCDGHDPIT